MNIQKCMLPHICNKHYIACSKQNVVFYYSLFVQIMNIIVNKATFTVRENPNAYIKNNINSINTHLTFS